MTHAHGTCQKHCLFTKIVIFPVLSKQLQTQCFNLPIKLVPSYILLNFALVFLVNMRTNWQFLFVNRELNCHYTIKSCTLYTAWTRLICKPSLKKELPILMWSMRPSQKDLAMNIWHLNWYLAQEHLKCVLFLDLPIEFLHCWSRAASLACFFAFSNSFCWKKTSNI